MSREDKSRKRLEDEVAGLRKRVAELEALRVQCKRSEEKERRQNSFLNRVIESLPHPFYVLDARDYTIQMANSAAAFGELTPNVTCYALTHRRNLPCDGDEHGCPLQIVKRTKRPVVLEHIHFDRDGNRRNVEVHATPLFDQKGEVVQIIEYALDVTQRRKIEEELRNYAEKMKLFAYSVSHDIKSPVIGIAGFAGLLRNRYGDGLGEEAKKFLDQIVNASEQVLAMIEEINVFIRAKEWPLQIEPLNLKEILQAVHGEFDPIFGNRRITWSEPENASRIWADRLGMLRVLRNLVDNALKYAGGNLSQIRIGYRESEKFHTISVGDDGVGIRQEACKKIFGLFQRYDSAKGLQGTGLGLAIVSEIAARHFGKAWVESESGRGATFYVSLSKCLDPESDTACGEPELEKTA